MVEEKKDLRKFLDAQKNKNFKKNPKNTTETVRGIAKERKRRGEGGYGRFFMCLESRWGRRGGLGRDYLPPLFLGLRAHALGSQKLMHVLTLKSCLARALIRNFLGGGALVVSVTCVWVGNWDSQVIAKERKKELTMYIHTEARGQK